MKPLPNAKSGFALVLTLMLMILMCILAVGLLTLSSIELRRSSSASGMERARANARMGLILAIGQLQQQLGPDRRVNAGASQLSNDSGVKTTAAVGRQHWTGVFDSWDSVAHETRPSPSFRSWLVSGNDTQTTNPDTPVSPVSENDASLWKGSLADGSDRVSVPKIEIRPASSANPDGACAWWIGDETSKALIRHVPEQNTLGNVYGNTQAAPGNALGLNSDLSAIQPDSPDLKLLASAGCLDLAAANPGLSGKLLHDFTSSSLGVAADVASGGLKRDLSLFLDHPVSKPVAVKLPNEDRLYPNGITWEELWLYHNVWRALEAPANGLASMTGGILGNTRILQTPGGTGEDSISAFRNDPFSIYKLPNYIRSQWLLSVWAQEKAGTAPNAPKTYNLYWVTDGILTFWNPYDVPIALHPDAYMSFKYWNLPYDLKIFSGNKLVAQTNFINAAGNAGDIGHSYTMIVGTAPSPYWGRNGTPDPVLLMPGEVLMMSENPGAGGPVPYDGNHAKRSLAMKAGWNLGRGRSKPMKLVDGTTITGGTGLRFMATPNSDIAYSALINQHYYYGADSRGPSQPPGTLTHSAGGRLVRPPNRASSYPDVFPAFSGDLGTANLMTGSGKRAFLMFSHQVKTEDSPTSWTRFFNPHVMQVELTKLDGPELATSGSEIVITGLSGPVDSNLPQASTTHINRGLFGGSYTDHSRGQDTVIVQSIPREPPLSLGAFQHAIANGFTERMPGGAALSTRSTTFSKPEISHAISNSYALPILAPASASGSEYQDHSYHANRMLWDSWFLSGIVQQQSPHHSSKRTASDVFEDFLDSEDPQPLPNRAIKPWTDDASHAAEALFAGSNAKPDAHELASSMLMIEGVFNVNSTSVEAWKSVLASLDGAFMPVAGDPNQPGSVEARQSNEVAVNNLLTAFGTGNPDSAGFEESSLDTPADKVQWRGYRKLSHDEIEALAEALVVEIRKRGPFLSLSDFVNRRLGPDKELALCGPLQAALDKTVNAKLLGASQRVATAPSSAGYAFPEAATISKSLTGPAHVTQAGILTPIGPCLTARSDTFRIRAYGEVRDDAGNITAEAWCEAVVQRTPDYLDPADPPQAAENTTGRSVPALTSNVNKTFGRRFITTSFRWVSRS